MSPIEKQLRKELGLTATEDLLEFAHATKRCIDRAKNVNNATATHSLILRDVYLQTGLSYSKSVSLSVLAVDVAQHKLSASVEKQVLVERVEALAHCKEDSKLLADINAALAVDFAVLAEAIDYVHSDYEYYFEKMKEGEIVWSNIRDITNILNRHASTMLQRAEVERARAIATATTAPVQETSVALALNLKYAINHVKETATKGDDSEFAANWMSYAFDKMLKESQMYDEAKKAYLKENKNANW